MANKKENNNNQLILVIKYYERFTLPLPGVNERYPRWGIVRVTPDGKIHLKVVERAQAKQKIAENGLVEYNYEEAEGKVFDTPDKAFQKRYAGISVPYDIANRQ